MFNETTMPNRIAGAGALKRVGFTLAEILIALALIAILAAVLLPTVASQIGKGDAGRVMQDADAVRAGIEQFLADVHRYPSKYSQLTKAITTADRDVNGTLYPSGLVAKWKGPYTTKLLNDASVLPTGFGAVIRDTLVKTLNASNSVNYVTVVIVGIDWVGFSRLELDIDGTSADSATAVTTGMLRWIPNAAGDTTRYLALPIQ